MAKERLNRRWVPFAWTAFGVGVAACLLAAPGNEHGSSNTNIDSMPYFGHDGMQTVAPAAETSLPPTAESASMFVCNSVILMPDGEVIARPVVDAATERPLLLVDNSAAGARFSEPQPLNEMTVLNFDGSYDADQKLNECAEQRVVTRKVAGQDVLALDPPLADAEFKNDGRITPVDAVQDSLVHYSFGPMSNAEVAALTQQLNDAA